MTKENYIKLCKYYKGEPNCPYGEERPLSDEFCRDNVRAFWWCAERYFYNHFGGAFSPREAVDCYITKGIEGGKLGEKWYRETYNSGEWGGD